MVNMYAIVLLLASLNSRVKGFRRKERDVAAALNSSQAQETSDICMNYCAADYHGWTQKCKWHSKCDGCPTCGTPFLEPVGVTLEENQCLCCNVKMEEEKGISRTLKYCLRVADFKTPLTKAHCAEVCLRNAASPSEMQKEWILSKFVEGQKCLGHNSRIDSKSGEFVQMMQRLKNKVLKRLGDVATCEQNDAYKQAFETQKAQLVEMANLWERKGGDLDQPKLRKRRKRDRDKGKLEHCEGTCKADSDCEEGLKCYKREGFQQVPTCRGRGRKDAAYCFKPDPNKMNYNEEEVPQYCYDNDEGVRDYMNAFQIRISNCSEAKRLNYCDDRTCGEEVRRQCGITCGCPEGSQILTPGESSKLFRSGSSSSDVSDVLRSSSSSGSFNDDKLVRYLSDYDEQVTPYVEAKLHHMIVRVDGKRRLHTPFEHICGGNDFAVSPQKGTDGASEWISFSNVGQYPSFGEDCHSAFDRGSRRVWVTKMGIWKDRGITIDMSSKSKAWKWCYEGGDVKYGKQTIHLEGAKDIKPWPYKCAKSVYQRVMQTQTGSPNYTFWNKKNRERIAKRCVDWATGAREVLVLPNPALVKTKDGESFDRGKKNRLLASWEAPIGRLPFDRSQQCYFSVTDRCVSMDVEKKEICCCSQPCSNQSCPLEVKV